MAHDPLFWVMAVGLVLAVVIVGGGWARMREQRHHVRELLRDTLGDGGRSATVQSSGPPTHPVFAQRG
jgi:hypothetical protein